MPTYVDLSTPGKLLSNARDGYERARLQVWLETGRDIGTTYANHAYRSYQDQVDLLKRNYDNTWRPNCTVANGGLRIWDGKNWYRKPGYPTAAKPGTSNHGDGDTVDFQNMPEYGTGLFNKIADILERNGFNNEEGARIKERWHWTYVRSNDKNYGEAVITVSEFTELKAMIEALPKQILTADLDYSNYHMSQVGITSSLNLQDTVKRSLVVGSQIKASVKDVNSAIAEAVDEALSDVEISATVDTATINKIKTAVLDGFASRMAN